MNKCGNWVRVNWELRCPICNKSDWCLVSADGTAAICPRTESHRDLGEAGFLHVLVKREDNWKPPAAPKDRRVEDMTALAEKCRRAISPGGLGVIAQKLGVSVDSVKAFGVGWSSGHQAFTFPSYNPLVGKITGIQLRRTSGMKWAVSGSRFGLYMPARIVSDNTLLVLEGASDPIAARHAGFPLVCGRHNCASGEGYVVAIVLEYLVERIMICSDNDKPNQWGRCVGRDGAEKLAKVLRYHVSDVRVVAPPEEFKDFRAWVNSGVTRSQIEEAWGL